MLEIFATLIKIFLLVGGLLTAAAYLVLLERWMAAWIQDRRGPNRVGIPLTNIKMFGLGQPLADGLKFIFKEEFTPSHVDKALFRLAPIVIMTAAVAIFAAIPFGSVLPPLGISGLQDPIPLLVAPSMDVGMVYIFALSSIAVYGVILGGWASNNKYSFLGGLRSSAQLISYEIPLGLGLLGVVLLSGTLRLDSIIAQQATTGVWNIFVQPLGCFVFIVAATAEAARLPFDLPEAEQELIGGYHTEFSGMKLLLFLIAEFLHMITAAFLIVILFLGGWHFWGLTGAGDRSHLGHGHFANCRPGGKNLRRHSAVHDRPLELAAVPVRSTDVAGLESDGAAGTGEPPGHRGPDRVRCRSRREYHPDRLNAAGSSSVGPSHCWPGWPAVY